MFFFFLHAYASHFFRNCYYYNLSKVALSKERQSSIFDLDTVPSEREIRPGNENGGSGLEEHESRSEQNSKKTGESKMLDREPNDSVGVSNDKKLCAQTANDPYEFCLGSRVCQQHPRSYYKYTENKFRILVKDNSVNEKIDQCGCPILSYQPMMMMKKKQDIPSIASAMVEVIISTFVLRTS